MFNLYFSPHTARTFQFKRMLVCAVLLALILPISSLALANKSIDQLEGIARVVAAFQNIGAHHLLDIEHELDCDVLVCGVKKG